MPHLVAPENDYRALTAIDPGPPRLRVCVIIPVYERVALLRRTLAGLAAQEGYPFELVEVVVADDGSTEDVGGAAADFADRLDIHVVRRERDGYGAAAARNLGLAATTADVVLFLDADCLPVRPFLAAHMRWHHRSEDVVVVGSRHHTDSTLLTEAALSSGAIEFPEAQAGDTDDWRRILYRRTNHLVHGTEAYRAVLSGNVSIARRRVQSIGGFSRQFTRWGGEDTEMGWRLWQSGLYIVPENEAAILHQGQEDGDRSWRGIDREANTTVLESLVPHRFYRKDLTKHIDGVPKVSWVVTTPAGPRVTELIDQMSAQRVADWDARFPLDQAPGSPRVKQLPDAAGSDAHRVLRAIAQTGSEYVALVSGAAGLDPLLLDRAVRALDRAQRASIALVGIDGEEASAAWTASGLPPFALVRRREFAKVLHEQADLESAWSSVRSISRVLVVDETLITLPAPAPTVPRSVTPTVSTRTRAAEAARTGGRIRQAIYRMARSMLRRRNPNADGLPLIAHLGDERSLAALATRAPWAKMVGGGTIQGIVIGGGAVIDADLAERVAFLDTPRVERAVAGATLGPEPSEWLDLLGTCVAVGLATSEAVAVARSLGIDAIVMGHPADGDNAAALILAALEEGIA